MDQFVRLIPIQRESSLPRPLTQRNVGSPAQFYWLQLFGRLNPDYQTEPPEQQRPACSFKSDQRQSVPTLKLKVEIRSHR